MTKAKHGFILKEFLDENNIKKEDVATLVDRAGSSIYRWLGEDDFSIDRIAILYMYLGIEPERFGVEIPHNNFRGKTNSTNTLHFYNKDNDVDMSNYFDSLVNTVSKVNKNLCIYDYFGKMSNDTLKSEVNFHKQQKRYFAAIEKNALKLDKSRHYTRIIALALRENKRTKREDCLAQAITSMFHGTFQHIWRCLFYENQFKLYITEAPTKTYSFGFVDDQYGISEYDRYDQKGNPKPDMLFITKRKSETSSEKIIDSYMREFSYIVDEGNNSFEPSWLIDRDMFEQTLEEVLYKKKEKMRVSSERLQEHKNQLNANLNSNSNGGDSSDKLDFSVPKDHRLVKDIYENLKEKYDYIKDYNRVPKYPKDVQAIPKKPSPTK